MQHFVVVALAVVIVVAGLSCGEAKPGGAETFAAYPPMEIDPAGSYSIILTTSVGRMTFKLLPEEAPLAVNSVVFLARQGFYDELTFHRVLPGELAETGDPSGTGTGGPGYTFEVEPPQRPYERGGLAMANTGAPNSNGSRFFIILGELTANGEPPVGYTVFGHIKENHAPSAAALEKIEAVALDPGPNGEVSLPQEEIKILSVTVTAGCAGGSTQISIVGPEC